MRKIIITYNTKNVNIFITHLDEFGDIFDKLINKNTALLVLSQGHPENI